MKKILLLAVCAASFSAVALPTYEPFTEYATAISLTHSNAIDLCTAGVAAPTGEVWGSLNFSGTFGTGIPGLDILVTNNPGLFSASALSSLLPTTFPGFPATGQSITNVLMNPAQPLVGGAASVNIIGNSAVLILSPGVTRPATGTKTLYISYLWSLAQIGQLGAGNDARYLSFVAASNVVEGRNTPGFYTNWQPMFDIFPNGTCIAATHAVIESNAGSFYNVACDNVATLGKEFATTPFLTNFAKVQFIVGAYTFNASGADTNTMWVDPVVGSLGGATPPASPIFNDTMPKNMSDIGGIVMEDRPGKGANAGGLGSNYMANLLVGTTWSFVTGGPEFTNQPANVVNSPGATVSLTAGAVAAAQSVTYQWQKIGSGNVAAGLGGAGGSATVSFSTNGNVITMTLAGISLGDAGNYQVVATASGTGFTLASSAASVTVIDPGFVTQPQPTAGQFAGSVTFSAQIQTATPGLTYAWYNNSTMIANGLQPDGSTATGATGSKGTGVSTVTLTLTNISYLDAGNYTLNATNNSGSVSVSAPASLTVTDPIIVVQPPALVEIITGSTATIPVAANGSGLTYQWNWTNGNGANVNNGEILGANTSTLTISSATANDQGTYSVAVSGASGQITNSSSTAVVFDTAGSSVAVTPPALTQQAGTHLALVGTVSGGSGAFHYIWQRNGQTLANGTQADGTLVSGASATLVGANVGALVLSNLHVADSGTYTLIASNMAGFVSAQSVITVSNGLLPLSTNNLVVTRVGEGAQTLSGATGNTLYLDQFTTNGGYVSSIMVPDSGGSQLIVPGAGADATNESYLTLSSNGAYLNFAGYFESYPFSGADVTVPGTTFVRGIGAVNALGYYALAYTNEGLYSGGNHFIRSAYSTDGLTNFWTTGAASGTAIKYVQAGPGGASYATGTGVPALSTATNGPRVIGLGGTNLVFSDFLEGSIYGLDFFQGVPQAPPAATTSTLLDESPMYPADFAFSPDTNTLYIADDSAPNPGGTSGGGGIDRYDYSGGLYHYAYTLEDTTGSQTNGIKGLTVYFPPGVTWGAGVTGAVLYGTTSEAVSNRLVKFVDNGQSSSPTLLATAGPNQFLRGVRFGPAVLPITITTPVQAATTFVGQSDTLTVGVSGDGPLSFQWQFDGSTIAGATTTSLVLTNLQLSNSGTYTVTIIDPISTNSSSAVVTVSAGPPLLVSAPQSRVETAGDHLAFTAGVIGTAPIFYQWSSNGVPVAGATTSAFGLTNIVAANSGTYSVTYSNQFGTNSVSATLQVTAGLQPLSSNNLVVVRVGDGVEALSATAGDTVYLDQFTPTGVYSNTIMAPDNSASGDLIVPGGTPEGPEGSVLTLSGNSTFLNFAGFDTTYPASDFTTGSGVFRDMAAVNAFGFFELAQINQTLYNGGAPIFNGVASQDGFAEFWTSGLAGSVAGIKYATAAFAGSGGGNASIGGTLNGTRVVQIISGNVVYSDAVATPPGIWAFTGEPTTASTPNNFVNDASGAPSDFSASPDTTTFPPSTSTVYVADISSVANGGGIQRYDWNGGAYALSYTLGTGAGSTVGASCLTVDYRAHASWGAGVTGAIIYATTAGSSNNQFIKIIDNGSGSAAAILSQANGNELLRGVRFGPIAAAPIVATGPVAQHAFVGGTAVFSVAAQNGPFTYQWQLNGNNLNNGASPSGSGAIISGVQTASLTVSNIGAADDQGSYTVVVSNPFPTPTVSAAALLSVPAQITVALPTPVYVTNGGKAVLTVTATGGSPLTYQWQGACGALSDGADPCGTGATIAGSSTRSLTISGAAVGDNGTYTVTVGNASGTNTPASSSVLTVVTAPAFAAPAVTGLSTSPQLNFSGQAGTPFRIWATTNLALKPVNTTWTLIDSGTFSGGADSFPISLTNRYQFFDITQP